MSLPILVLACAGFQAPNADVAQLQLGDTRTLTIAHDDARHGEHGPAQELHLELKAPLTLIAWATSTDFDPWIEFVNEHGDVVASDDGLCDAHSSCTRFLSVVDMPLIVRVGAALPDASGTLTFHIDGTPENDATMRAHEEMLALVTKARAKRDAGEFEEAARLAREETRRVLDLPSAKDSWAAVESLPPLGDLLYRQDEFDLLRELSERSLAMRERMLPTSHALYRGAIHNYGLTLHCLGRFRESLELFERDLELCRASLPDDDDSVLNARYRVAMGCSDVGDFERAIAVQRALLESVTSPRADNPAWVDTTRAKLGDYYMQAGELAAARAMYERALADSEKRADDQRLVLSLRANLGWVLWLQGDLSAARAIQEPGLELAAKTMAEDDLELQRMRMLYALTLSTLGETAQARELEELVYKNMSLHLPPEHPGLVTARTNLALSRLLAGELDSAIDLLEEGVAALDGAVPPENETLLTARRGLALGLSETGRFEDAREILRDVVALRERSLPADHPILEGTHSTLLMVAMRLRDRDETEALAHTMARDRCASQLAATSVMAPRELAAFVALNEDTISLLLSASAGCGALEPIRSLEQDAFTAMETMRGAELACARVLRSASRDEHVRVLRERARAASQDVVQLARVGHGDDFTDAVRTRDQLQRDLLSALEGSASWLAGPTPAAIAARLEAGSAAIAFRSYGHYGIDDPLHPVIEARLVAFVVRHDAPLARFDLGPTADVVRACERWQASLLAEGESEEAKQQRERGAELRKLVLDPLAPALNGVRHLELALDDVLHTIPFDALPSEDGCVGDRLEVRVRPALWELLFDDAHASPASDLVVCGGVDFGEGAAGDFHELPGSATEAHEIAHAFGATSAGADEHAHLLLGAAASRAELERLAHGARYLHLATHGYFAANMPRPATDARGAEDLGLGDMNQEVRSASPLTLCGIALAGANRPADAFGQRTGIVTAEELATFDLSGCELAVLSACDTSVGVERAGQGVCSLQRALHMAGARTVVTSLWKVSDQATRELMGSFYRRIWTDHEAPARALWEAKRELRARRAPLRDWAGWVISGG